MEAAIALKASGIARGDGPDVAEAEAFLPVASYQVDGVQQREESPCRTEIATEWAKCHHGKQEEAAEDAGRYRRSSGMPDPGERIDRLGGVAPKDDGGDDSGEEKQVLQLAEPVVLLLRQDFPGQEKSGEFLERAERTDLAAVDGAEEESRGKRQEGEQEDSPECRQSKRREKSDVVERELLIEQDAAENDVGGEEGETHLRSSPKMQEDRRREGEQEIENRRLPPWGSSDRLGATRRRREMEDVARHALAGPSHRIDDGLGSDRSPCDGINLVLQSRACGGDGPESEGRTPPHEA